MCTACLTRTRNTLCRPHPLSASHLLLLIPVRTWTRGESCKHVRNEYRSRMNHSLHFSSSFCMTRSSGWLKSRQCMNEPQTLVQRTVYERMLKDLFFSANNTRAVSLHRHHFMFPTHLELQSAHFHRHKTKKSANDGQITEWVLPKQWILSIRLLFKHLVHVDLYSVKYTSEKIGIIGGCAELYSPVNRTRMSIRFNRFSSSKLFYRNSGKRRDKSSRDRSTTSHDGQWDFTDHYHSSYRIRKNKMLISACTSTWLEKIFDWMKTLPRHRIIVIRSSEIDNNINEQWSTRRTGQPVASSHRCFFFIVFSAGNDEHWYARVSYDEANHSSDPNDDEPCKWSSPAKSARLAQRSSPDHRRVPANDRCLVFVCEHYWTTRSTRIKSHLHAYSEHDLFEIRTAVWAHLFSRWTCTWDTLSHSSTSHSSPHQPTDRWPVRNRRCFPCERISGTAFIIVDGHRRILRSRFLPK
jgi:hypothetical protein